MLLLFLKYHFKITLFMAALVLLLEITKISKLSRLHSVILYEKFDCIHKIIRNVNFLIVLMEF